MNPHAECALCVPTREQNQCCGDEREDFLTVLRVISWTRQWKPLLLHLYRAEDHG